MNDNGIEIKKMWELIKVIEEAGIEIRSAKWEEEGHLNIDVDEKYHDEATAAIQTFWNKKQEEHMQHIGLVAIPWEEES